MAEKDEKALPRADEPASSAASVVDSGVDAGPSNGHGSHGHDLLQAGAESDEASTDTDEG